MSESITTISRSTDLNPSMDYSFLREEGLQLIQNLAGKIWTDHNIHDPGITMLEVLCYAVTDLGYRTDFGMEDILAGASATPERDFFSLSEIATNNPLTIEDFERILRDIPGVRSGKLELAKASETGQPMLGLYHVFVQLEEHDELGNLNDNSVSSTLSLTPSTGVPASATVLVEFAAWDQIPVALDKVNTAASNTMNVTFIPIQNTVTEMFAEIVVNGNISLTAKITVVDPLEDIQDGQAFTNQLQQAISNNINIVYDLIDKRAETFRILDQVSERLHQYRNLCEDFLSVQPTDVQKLGLNLEVVIRSGVNAEEVQKNIFLAMDRFFSPLVRFYSLSEMLDKGYAPETILEGPKLNNGFLDREELENSVRGTTILLSDLVQIIMDLEHVEEVKDLSISSHKNGTLLAVADSNCINLLDTVRYQPVFESELSEITYFEKGRQSYKADRAVAQGLYEDQKSQNRSRKYVGKRMDFDLVQGDLSDLAEYYSIQHDYPQAYGIGEGGPLQVGDPLAIAKARQLKAFNLFFEQLLADYFTQLSGVRSLFAVHGERLRSYFSQSLLTVPNVGPLLRGFVQHAAIHDLDVDDPEALETYAQHHEHNMVSASSDYLNNLENLYENTEEAYERQSRVLDHLLSRFSEEMTDYALYLYRTNETEADRLSVEGKSEFLSNYPALSSERGKGFNYRQITESGAGSWATDNVAGLKKRVSGLLGLTDVEQDFLSPVKQFECYQDQAGMYRFRLLDANGIQLLHSVSTYATKAAANAAMMAIAQLGTDAANYVQSDDGIQHWIELRNAALQVVASSVNDPALSSTQNDTHQEKTIAQINTMREAFSFHVVENILLRKRSSGEAQNLIPLLDEDNECEEADDPYSFRVNIVLPAWTSRSQDPDYQQVFRNTLREQTPAHVLVQFYWLSEEQMLEFEETYRELLLDLNGAWENPVSEDLVLWLDQFRGDGTETDRLEDHSLQFNDGMLKTGKALDTGSTQSNYVKTENITNLDGADQVTVATWVYVNAYESSYDYVFSLPNDQTGSFGFDLQYRGTGNFVVSCNTSAGYKQPETPASTGTWYRAVCVYDGAIVQLYLNGELAVSEAHTGTLLHGTNNLYLGGYSDDAGLAAYSGDFKLSDVQVWSSAWTADDVTFDYSHRETLVTHNPATALKASNLEVWFPLTEGAGSYIYDASSNAHTGAFVGTPTWEAGLDTIPQTALMSLSRKSVFVDADNSYYQSPMPKELSANMVQLTASCLVQHHNEERLGVFTNWHSSGRTFLWYTGGAEMYFFLSFEDGTTLYTSTNNGQGFSVGQQLHLVGTYDGQEARVYINGVYIRSKFKKGKLSCRADGEMYFGRYSIDDNIATGIVDECALFDRALTDEQVVALHNGGKIADARKHDASEHLIGYWRNNPIDGQWEDLSGSGNHATPVNNPATITLREGIGLNRDGFGMELNRIREANTLNLDGTGFAEIAHDASLELTGDLSLEAWIRPTKQDGAIFSKGPNAASGYALMQSDDGRSWAGIDAEGSFDRSKAENPLETWSHVTATYLSGSGTWTYYRNGKEVGSYVDSQTYSGNTDALLLGKRSDDSSYFEGAIGTIRVYKDRALNAQEVMQNFLTQKTTDLSAPLGEIETDSLGVWMQPEPGPVEDDNYRLLDQSANANNIQLYTGKGLTTNGTSDFVKETHIYGLHESEAVTLACWVRVESWNDTEANSYFVSLPRYNSSNNGIDFYHILGSDGNFNTILVTTGGISVLNTTVELKKWYRAVATYDGAVHRLFMNGVEVDSGSHSGTLYHNSQEAYLGAFSDKIGAGNTPARFTNATLSDVQAWNVGWSAEDVVYDYTYRENLVTDLPGTSITSSNLRLWWPLTEGYGTRIYGGSENQAIGTLNGCTWATGLDQVPQTGLMNYSRKHLFEGVTGTIIEGPFAHSNWTEITVSAKFMAHSFNHSGIVGDWNSPDASFLLFIHTTQIAFTVNTDTSGGSAGYNHSNLLTDRMYTLIGTYDGTTAKLYIDGVEVSSVGITGTLESGAQEMLIGGYGNNAFNFDGIIDECSVFNKALTTAEVAELHDNGAMLDARSHSQAAYLKGYWRNNPANETWKDLTANGNDLPAVGTLSHITMRQGKDAGRDVFASPTGKIRVESALNMDGSGYAVVPHDDSVNPTGSMTLEAWINPAAADSAAILAKGPSATERYFLTFASQKIVASIGYANDYADSTLPLDAWYHVVASYNSSNATWYYYIDGEADGTAADNGGLYSNPAQSDLYIGTYEYIAYRFTGQMGDLRMYKDLALTADQVRTHFNVEKAKYGK